MKIYYAFISLAILGIIYCVYSLYTMTPYYGSKLFKKGDCIIRKNAGSWEKDSIEKIVNIDTYRYQYIDCYIRCNKRSSNTSYLYMYEKTECTEELKGFK